MTYEEALNMVQDAEIRYYGEMTIADEIIELKNKCCEALEKQIPKKPIDKQIVNDGYAWQYICPCCDIRQVSTEKSHCGDCGQALDWSDENEERNVLLRPLWKSVRHYERLYVFRN